MYVYNTYIHIYIYNINNTTKTINYHINKKASGAMRWMPSVT